MNKMKKSVIIKTCHSGFLPFFPLLLLLFACDSEEKKISEDRPYAIELARERSLYQAEKLQDRLKDMGVSTYVVKKDSANDSVNDWYFILTGAEKNLEDVQDLRKQLNEKYNLKEKKIVLHEDFKNAEFDLKKIEKTELKRVLSKKPDVPEPIFEIASKFPESNALFVSKGFIINSPADTVGYKGYTYVYNFSMDLPRGISKDLMLKRTVSFAEVVYKDNIYGDRVTIDIGKLRNKDSEKTVLEMAETYADLILKTGNYNTEEKEEVELLAWEKLIGYRVTIEPKKNYFRTYLILVNMNRDYLIFSQSTEKSLKELEKILTTLGKGQGLTTYDEFYNTFYTLPKDITEDDVFIGFIVDKLGWDYTQSKSYTKWSKLCVGHWSAKSYFYNSKKGIWSYGIFDLLTKEKSDLMQELYVKETANKSNNIVKQNVYGVEGFAVYKDKFNRNTYKSYKKIEEINWNVNRYATMIDNTENSWLNKDELLERAESLQF